VDTTATFTAAIKFGDLTKAEQTYPAARLHYERIEPIAELFGDLDALIDMRADEDTGGTPSVGFHALEQLLFVKHTLTAAKPLTGARPPTWPKLAELV
jgi:iron uptake system component EfeO